MLATDGSNESEHLISQKQRSLVMRILVVADLHLDQWIAARRDPLAALPEETWASIDALIIAGDLSNKPRVRWAPAIRRLARHIDPGRIHIIPGNHDYYDHRIDGEDALADIAREEGAHLAQMAELRLGPARVLCCTLWTDFALHGDAVHAASIARARMNDYRLIRHAGDRYRRLQPRETAALHRDHRDWLGRAMSSDVDGPTIAVTHHCPHPALLQWPEDELAPAYASDLSELIARQQPDLWLSGHTHAHLDAREGRTRMRCVSLGYPDQVRPGREADLMRRGIVDIDASGVSLPEA